MRGHLQDMLDEFPWRRCEVPRTGWTRTVGVGEGAADGAMIAFPAHTRVYGRLCGRPYASSV